MLVNNVMDKIGPKYIVSNLLDTIEGINWPREMGMGKKLMNNFPQIKWDKVFILKKPKSLAYFLTPKGLQQLESIQEQQTFNMFEAPKIELAAEKIGQDGEIAAKPVKTLMDFIKKGEREL